MKKLELDVRGMTCDTCPQHVENALLSVSGVQKVEIQVLDIHAYLSMMLIVKVGLPLLEQGKKK